MQTLIQVICNKNQRSSLREEIANDNQLQKFDFEVIQFLKPERPKGWLKIKSIKKSVYGALNIQWDYNTKVLSVRVVNRGWAKPAAIVGDFIDYLLARYKARIKAINIFPVEKSLEVSD